MCNWAEKVSKTAAAVQEQMELSFQAWDDNDVALAEHYKGVAVLLQERLLDLVRQA